jgi:hypothetical protein
MKKIVLILVISFFACKEQVVQAPAPSPAPSTPAVILPPTFASVQPILAANCALNGCHDGTQPAARPMDFRLINGVPTSRAYNDLMQPALGKYNHVQVFRVRANYADSSALVLRLQGLILPAMPPAQLPVSSFVIAFIRQWINNGAVSGLAKR